MEAKIKPSKHGLHHAPSTATGYRSRLGSARGQGLVEFALILPVFMLLLLGLLDFGSAYNIHNDMTHLAGEAVRFAAVDNCEGCPSGINGIADQVRHDAGNDCLAGRSGCGATGPDKPLIVCFTFPDAPGLPPAVGEPVEAVVETNYRWFPFLNLANVKLRATATMRLEQVPTGSPTSDVYDNTVLVNGDCPDYSG